MQAGGLQNIARFELGLKSEQIKNQDNTIPPEEVLPLLNRLSKNLKNRSKLWKYNNIDCYRIYDSELPEYNVVIDRFADYLHIRNTAPQKRWTQRVPTTVVN